MVELEDLIIPLSESNNNIIYWLRDELKEKQNNLDTIKLGELFELLDKALDKLEDNDDEINELKDKRQELEDKIEYLEDNQGSVKFEYEYR